MTTPESYLTPAEREVLNELLEGHTNAQIAKRLRISAKTVKNHVSHILAKTGFSSRLKLTVAVYKERTKGLRRRLRAA
jgi:DNA-binding CsgD family transcriptional regulator